MKKIFLISLLGLFASTSYAARIKHSNIETLVFVRHGEKPDPDTTGLLTCQGLNRALKLPQVLLGKFGNPDALFTVQPYESTSASTPTRMRPFQTILPLAIGLGMTPNMSYAETDITLVSNALLDSQYTGKTVFVVWEHKNLELIATNIYTQIKGNDASTIPKWKGEDFDSIWIFNVYRDSSGTITDIIYSQDSEGLDNMSTTCPN